MYVAMYRRGLCRTSALALVAGLFLFPSLSRAQVRSPNQVDAPTLVNVEDKDDIRNPGGKIWALDFKFYSPRLITVDIPGRGRKLCWYMKYEVINRTKEPRTFYPIFELVTLDKPGVYRDQVLPKVQEAIIAQEDPAGTMDFKDSVTMSSKPIPVSRPDGPARAVAGLAIWDDVNPDSNRYSVFVGGLSNGWSLAEIPPDNKQVVRRKTLQLNFKRNGDRFNQSSSEIRFEPPVEWVYRTTSVSLEEKPGAAKPAGAAQISTPAGVVNAKP